MKTKAIIPAIGVAVALSQFMSPIAAMASPPTQTILTTVEPTTGFVEEISRTQLSGIINASPRCWTVAINALSEFMYFGTHSSSDFCAAMTQLQQDVLALELSRCHMEKSRTPFIIDSDTVSADNCAGGNLVDQSQVDACLAHLDTNSYNVYVQFTMHVQQLCVRFTDELVAARSEQAALLLAQSSHAVSKQLADLMDKNDKLINKVVEQQELLGNQSRKIQEFNDAIENMREDISSTTNHIQPIESVVRRMTQGFSWFASFLHFLVALNVAWLLTMNKRSRRARSALVNLILFEALLEVLSHWTVYNDYLRREDQVIAVTLWRKTFLVIELCTYVVGTTLSFFCRQSGRAGGGDDKSEALAAIKASQAVLHQVTRETAEARRQMVEQNREIVEMWRKRQGADTSSRLSMSPNYCSSSAPPHPAMYVSARRQQQPVQSRIDRQRRSLPPQSQPLSSLPNSEPSRALPSAAELQQRSVLPDLKRAGTSEKREVTPEARKRKRKLEHVSSGTDAGRRSSSSGVEVEVEVSDDEKKGNKTATSNKKKRT